MQRLGAAEHGGQRLDGHARHVVQRLLRRRRHARRLRVRAQPHRLDLLRPVPLLHEARPHPARRPQLGDLLEEVVVDVEEERQPRRERVHVEPACHGGFHVPQAVGQREGQLLHGRRARLADVIAGDRDGIEARHVPRRELDHVGHDAHGGLGRTDPFLLRDELLEHVVLHGAAETVPRHALLVGDGQVHGQRHRRRAVDRHRGRDVTERDVGEEPLEVVQGRDRHAFLPDFSSRPRMVRVITHQGRHIERRRETCLSLLQQELESCVGVFGPAEAREHAHRPQPPAVHRRVHAAGERVLPGLAEAVFVASRDVVGRIERLEGDARERLESHVALFPLTFLTHLSTSRAMTSFWICDVPS